MVSKNTTQRNRFRSDRPEPLPEVSSAGTGNEHPAEEEAAEIREVGGPKGPEPTRYGDWEVKGRCSDF